MATRLNPTVVAVTPVLGALFEPLTVGAQEALSLELENLSATETFTGYVRSRLSPNVGMAVSTLGDLNSVPPSGTVGPNGEDLSKVLVTLDLPANAEVDVVGLMTGLGGDVRVTALPRASRSIAMGQSR
jgi:hypothetical protein